MDKILLIALFVAAAIILLSGGLIRNSPITSPVAVPAPASTSSYTDILGLTRPGAPAAPAPVPAPGVQPVVVPAGFTPNDLSPDYRKVRINSAARGYGGTSYGQVILQAEPQNKEAINVTGWVLKANRGSQTIARAVEVYDPSGIGGASDIALSPGHRLSLHASESAIRQNLRLNKCIGYIENSNKFTPRLPQTCPMPAADELRTFTGQCQNYILSIPSCVLPQANPPVPQNDYACRNYIDRLNYRGCFEKHRADADFLGTEWWAWMNSEFLDPSHDRVLLLDRKGLLVDLFTY